MSEAPIDPYAPPTTFVEEHEYERQFDEEAYRDGDMLLIKPSYRFGKVCPKTGKKLYVGTEAKFVHLYCKRKWVERSSNAKAISLAASASFLVGLFFMAGPFEREFGWLFVLIGVTFMFFLSFPARYSLPIYFSDAYLQKWKRSTTLYASLPIAVVVTAFISSNKNPMYFWGYSFMLFIAIFALTLALFLLKSRHFKIKEYRNGFLYIKGAGKEFLDTLPAFSLSL